VSGLAFGRQRPTASAAKLEAVFMFGLPGAGKTSLARRRFPNHLILDPDVMPDLAVRKAQVFREAVAARRRNLVINSTSDSSNVDHRVWQMAFAREHGYRRVLMYVKVDLETALARNAKRVRRVPETAIREQAVGIASRFERLRGNADVVQVIRND
jgi:predicted kinase